MYRFHETAVSTILAENGKNGRTTVVAVIVAAACNINYTLLT